MILDRLGVRGKLNLLLMLPLTAVVLVSVPFVAGQIENARSSSATSDAARNAQQLGALVWELQPAAVDLSAGRDLMTTASAQSQMFTERVVQQADVDQAGLVVLVDQGEAARRVDALAQRLPQVSAGTARDFVVAALAAAESQ